MQDLLVHRGQNNEALFVCFHKSIHALVLILIKANFLSDASQIETNGWIRNDHLET